MTCVELTNTSTTILQYSDTVEGSLLTISCLEGYYLPGGDMMSMCTNGSWSPNPLNIVCVPEGIVRASVFLLCVSIDPYRDSQCQCRQRAYYSTDSWYCVQCIISDCWSCAWSSEYLHQKWSKKKVVWSHLPLSPSPPPTSHL